MIDLQTFSQTDWLSSLWAPLHEAEAALVDDLESVLESAYAQPFEDLCLIDHQESQALEELHEETVARACKAAYLAAWTRTENPEFSGLVGDDVRAIASLLILRPDSLRRFTQGRLNWLIRGRFACGYLGEFPNGTWLVA